MTAITVEQTHPHDFQGRVPGKLPTRVMRELSVLRPHKAITAVVLEWVYILAAIALCEKLRSPLVYAAAVIWIGARQHALTVAPAAQPWFGLASGTAMVRPCQRINTSISPQ